MKNDTRLRRSVPGAVKRPGHAASVGRHLNAGTAAPHAGVEAHVVLLCFAIPGTGMRSDGDLALSANNALAWHMHIPLDAVKVAIEQGFVTLSGTLDRENQRQCAVDIVRNLAGVTGIRNRIALRPMALPGRG